MSGLLKSESSSGLKPPWRAPSASKAWIWVRNKYVSTTTK